MKSLRFEKKSNLKRQSARTVLFALLLLGHMASTLSAQTEKDSISSVEEMIQEVDTARAYTGDAEQAQKFQKDTIKETPNDFSPLDIGSNRGIFILSANKLLQLRILGSVRANFHYSDDDLEGKETFNPFDIPTASSFNTPIYYAGYSQTRLGFEITRRTMTRGDIFVRLEGDFNSSSGGFRVRHAYGEIGRFLVGMTWSLTNNVGYQPAMVSSDGAVGSIGLRTPQIRYSHKFSDKMGYSLGLEYSKPQIQIPDSIGASAIQVIPDLMARLTYNSDRLSLRFSGAFTTISGRVFNNTIEYAPGYLASLAGIISSVKGGNLYFSFSAGHATSHFMDTFNGKSQDLVYNSDQRSFVPLDYWAGYISYSHDLPQNFSASLSLGYSDIDNKDFQLDRNFNNSYNTLLNLFWDPAEGARLGLEYAHGKRVDKGDDSGYSNRISLLMYYDF